MASISYPSATEVQLRLGAHENEILIVMRHGAWWTRAEVEGRVPGDAEVTAVILTADRPAEQTIREILHRSFQLVFPDEGGDGVPAPAKGMQGASRPMNGRVGSTRSSR